MALPRWYYAPSVTWQPDVQEYFAHAFGPAKLRRMSEALARPPLKQALRVNTLRCPPGVSTTQLQEHVARELQQQLNLRDAPRPHDTLPNTLTLQGRGPLDVDYSACEGRQVVINRYAGEAVLRGANVYCPGLLAASAGLAEGDMVGVSVALELPGSNRCGIPRGTVLPTTNAASDAPSSSTAAPPLAPKRRTRAKSRSAPHNLSGSSGTPGTGTVTPPSATARPSRPDGSVLQGPAAAALPPRDHLFLGVGRCVSGRRTLFRNQTGLAVEMAQRVFESPPINGVLPGRIMLQALPSITAAQVLSPTPGSRVLDMCAAPGGKTTLLAELMQDRGEVWALDRTHTKVAGIKDLAASFGITCITAVKADATRAVRGWRATTSSGPDETSFVDGGADLVSGYDDGKGDGSSEEAAGERGATAAAAGSRAHADEFEGFEPESFDHILLDPPCSALGLRPRLHHPWTLKQLLDMAQYQRALLHTAVALLKPGGTLVYSTCTINPAENEGNVRYALDRWGVAAGAAGCQLQLLPATPLVGSPGMCGPWAADSRDIGGRGSSSGSSSSGNSSSSSSSNTAVVFAEDVSSFFPATNQQRPPSPGPAPMPSYNGWLTQEEAVLVQRFDPDDAQGNDSIGFFVAKFYKGVSWKGQGMEGRREREPTE